MFARNWKIEAKDFAKNGIQGSEIHDDVPEKDDTIKGRFSKNTPIEEYFNILLKHHSYY